MAFSIHDIQIPEKKPSMPIIGVMGVGGAGVNSVTNMINSDLTQINSHLMSLPVTLKFS